MTVRIVALIVLMAVLFIARAQESDTDNEVLIELVASCAYISECYDVVDNQKETVLVELRGFMCSGEDFGKERMTRRNRNGLGPLGIFIVEGLNYGLFFEDQESKFYAILVQGDGTGVFYDLSNEEEGESIKLSEKSACVDRSDEAADRIKHNPWGTVSR